MVTRFAVDDVLCAQLLQVGHLLLPVRHGENLTSLMHGHLREQLPHAPGGAMHKNALARLHR